MTLGEINMNKFIILITLLVSNLSLAQNVLVTGSNRGIGYEFVSQYAERGWSVIATSRSPHDDVELINLAEKYSNITIEKLDVTSQEDIDNLVDKLSGQSIDLLINNAVDYLMPDLGRAGGVTETKEICALAKAFGKKVTPHNNKINR